MLGVYPTNELLRDQERALQEEYQRLGTHQVLRVDSIELDKWQADLDLKRHSDTLETLLGYDETTLLTNPDILFYVIFGLYPTIPGLRERLWELVGRYHLFVFDEFHLYSVKQQADVAFFIGALQTINAQWGRVFVFASATPDLAMKDIVEKRLGIRVLPVEAQPVPAGGRIIAQEVELTLVPADLDRWQGTAALDLALAKMGSEPDLRSVAIFDSVVGALETAQRCRAVFGNHAVGEVHGLSSQAQRLAALSSPITVGTSTIEVGVNFKDAYEKDVLVFEARTSGNFLQRFGRIARHEKIPYRPNYAIAIVPESIYNFLRDRVQGQNVISREKLRTLVEDAYRQPEAFGLYLRKHAAIEMVEAAKLVQGMFQPDEKPRIQHGLNDVIYKLTGKTARDAQSLYKQYVDERIIRPLLTFRGNELQAAFIDQRFEDPGFPAKRYNFFFLLRRGQIRPIHPANFIEHIEQLERRTEWKQPAARERRFARLIEASPEELLGVYAFFELNGFLDQSRRVWLEINESELRSKIGTVSVIQGLSIATDDVNLPLALLNKTLGRKKLTAWTIDQNPASIKFGRALPPLFTVSELRVMRPGGMPYKDPWSIVFNQDAFLLDSLPWNTSRTPDILIF